MTAVRLCTTRFPAGPANQGVTAFWTMYVLPILSSFLRTNQRTENNVARITWKNGIATGMHIIQKGFDSGTCGQFKDVKCEVVKKPSG